MVTPLLSPFHLAISVHSLHEARHFYGTQLGLEEGRSSTSWIDYNLFGHQLVVHLDESMVPDKSSACINNLVDGHQVPVPHFGVVLPMKQWLVFVERVKKQLAGNIRMEPTIRFKGQPGEQGTIFFVDPSGNALEFKGFQNIELSLFNKSGQY